ncbi:hypothetical protein TNCT_91451 [Trichonephila clavata]|uniref:Uncharacterized protein n=1 Tax=Trichonephila clavata TaxID=2740835 RepID=A0A8X6GT62_TRICU|nr:hypothetical protein TNCT_91451 [Trichonephila clavata]
MFTVHESLRITYTHDNGAGEWMRLLQITISWMDCSRRAKQVVRVRSISKYVVVCVFCKTDHMKAIAIDQHWAVNFQWCMIICLSLVIGEIQKAKHSAS